MAGNSREVVTDTAREGFVLVKNNGLLLLSGDTVALNVFGWASAYPVYSGTGSAASGDGSKNVVSIYDSLENAGYAINEELPQMYLTYGQDFYDGRPTINMTSQDWTLLEPTAEYYTDSVMSTAESFSDVAVIVIGRSGGENADLPTDMKVVIDGTFNIAGTDTDAATCVLAMRQFCKNILYTTANSGYYQGEASTGSMSNMNKLFLGMDVGAVLVCLGLDAVIVLRWLKKRKTSVTVE